MSNIYREHIEWCDIWISAAAAGTPQPRALLIGDSICRGYYPAVERCLAGSFASARLATSRFVRDPVHQREVAMVLEQYRFQVIHFNNGLHGWDYSEADYLEGLHLLVEFLRRQAPAARLVWAHSTPIYRTDDLQGFDPRHERVIERNRLAAGVMASHGIAVNDLFALALGQMAWFDRDGVHYNAEGYGQLATQVAASITDGA